MIGIILISKVMINLSIRKTILSGTQWIIVSLPMKFDFLENTILSNKLLVKF